MSVKDYGLSSSYGFQNYNSYSNFNLETKP